MAQDAPKRRFLSLIFLVSWIYLACTLNLKVNLMVKNKRAKQGRIFDPLSDIMHLSSASPRGVPRADVGGIRVLYGDFATNFSPCGGGNVGTLNALLSGNMWGLRFCSTERRLGISKESIRTRRHRAPYKDVFSVTGRCWSVRWTPYGYMSKNKTSATEKAKKDNKKARRQELSSRCQEESVYCICRRGKEGFMIQCSNCNKWFHGECVRVTDQDADQIEDYFCATYLEAAVEPWWRYIL